MNNPTAEEIQVAQAYFETHGTAIDLARLKHSTKHGRTLAAAYREAIEALQRAQRFISNGIEFGYIRTPEPPDPAVDTLPKINAVLAKAKEVDG